MATINPSLVLNTVIDAFRFSPSGDVSIDYRLVDASNATKGLKSVVLRADGSGAYDVSTGAQLAAVTPPAFLTAATALKTQADNALTAAAAAGKIAL